MREPARIRARRVDVPADLSDRVGRVDYASAFAIPVAGWDRSPECWAHAVFDQAPAWLRGPVLVGWRRVLRLRLAPHPSTGSVLGWRVTGADDRQVFLEADSPLLTGRKVVQVASGSLTVATFVRCGGRFGRLVWSVVAVVHHRTEPMLLNHAVRTASDR